MKDEVVVGTACGRSSSGSMKKPGDSGFIVSVGLQQCETGACVAPSASWLERDCQTPSSLSNAASRSNAREAPEQSKSGQLSRTPRVRIAKKPLSTSPEEVAHLPD